MSRIRGHQMECAGGPSRSSTGHEAREGIEEYFRSSNCSPSDSDSIEELMAMFPDVPCQEVEHVLCSEGDVNKAAERLLEGDGTMKFDDIPGIDSVDDLMKHHKQSLQLVGFERIQVDREDLWPDSVATFKDPKFNLKAHPRVTFVGEAGIDAGGPRREYATLLRQQIFSANVNLFEGPEKNKLPIYSIQGLQSRMFYLVGKMIAYNIIHLDIGVPCFSRALYQYMATGNMDESSTHCNLNDVPDFAVQEWINQVTTADSKESMDECIINMEMMDVLVRAGWLQPLTITNKALATQCLLVHEILHKRREPTEQLMEGLESLGVMSLIRSKPHLMQNYFISEKQLTSDSMLALFEDIHKVQEQEKKDRARLFLIRAVTELESSEGSVGLCKFLKFLTGLEEIPPLGPTKLIQIEYVERGQTTFFAETCLGNLQVPTAHAAFGQFEAMFKQAIEHHLGFGAM